MISFCPLIAGFVLFVFSSTAHDIAARSCAEGALNSCQQPDPVAGTDNLLIQHAARMKRLNQTEFINGNFAPHTCGGVPPLLSADGVTFTGKEIRTDYWVKFCQDCANRCWLQMGSGPDKCIGVVFAPDASDPEHGACTFFSQIDETAPADGRMAATDSPNLPNIGSTTTATVTTNSPTTTTTLTVKTVTTATSRTSLTTLTPASTTVPAPTIGSQDLKVSSATMDVNGEVRAVLQVEGALSGQTLGGFATSGKRTIYYFTPDGIEDGVATFRGSTWPLVYVPAEASISIDVEGIKSLSVSSNSERLLLVDGKPAYQFASDSDATTALGHTLGNRWFAFDRPADLDQRAQTTSSTTQAATSLSTSTSTSSVDVISTSTSTEDFATTTSSLAAEPSSCPYSGVALEPCIVPSSTDWLIEQSCLIQSGSYSFRKVIVTKGASVAVAQEATVKLDLTGGLKVDRDSQFWVGCEDMPFTGSMVTTFKGTYDDLKNREKWFGVDYNEYGLPERSEVWANVLLNSHGGRLELHGRPKTSWVYLRKSAALGSNTLQVDVAPMNWQPGDEIIVAQTGKTQNEAERAIIESVNGRVVKLQAPLWATHDGHWTGRGSRLNAEVGMLSHNIKFTSDVDYGVCEDAFRNMNDNTKERCFAGHASFLQHSVTRIENVEFDKMGQGLMMGRYALHFHLAGDQQDSYLKNNGVHRGFNRCITLHGAFNALVEGNVCLDNRGHNIYLEDGIEAGNRIINNLVVNPKTSGTICTDRSQTGLWITNPNNTFTGNAIVGAVFGAWFTFPTADGAHPFSGEKRGQLGGIFGASKNYYMDQASGFGPDSWIVRQEQARTPVADFSMNSFKGSQSSGITIDFRVYDSEDPQIPCFEGSAYSRGPCPTCASVGHTFSWGPMSFDPDVLPQERQYLPVANLWPDIIVAYTAQTGAFGESFSFWSTGGSVKFERPIFVDNEAGSSLGFTGECAAGVTFNAAGYQAEWSNALFLKGKPAFKLYDGGYSCTGCRWAELESVVTMRPGSPGNVNGVLFQNSAPLGWFDSDANDPLYKWVFDSGVQLEPRSTSISNMVDWSSQFLLGPTWQSADVNIMTTDGFGDALQIGFLQLKYSGNQFANVGWGRGAEVESSPKCRHFYPCNRGMWCGDGRSCEPFVRCADIPNRPTCCLDQWVGQR